MSVNVEKRGATTVLTLNSPPVNALGTAVKTALEAAIKTAMADSSVMGVVIAGAGKHFSGGADIREFEAPPAGPSLPDVIDLVERAEKPVVAALHGTVAGGATELALGCHYRVADEDALISLPEVTLGLLPGAGGTVRLPRLVGAEAALDLILNGRKVGAAEAVPMGLVDEVVPAKTALARAIAFAERMSRRPIRRTRDLPLVALSADVMARVEADLAKSARGRKAPHAALACVKRAFTMPFDEALRQERDAFMELVGGTESKALRHVFFAEREAQKVAELKKGTTVRAIRNVGVVGFGTMGSGIAMAFANAGMKVVVADETQPAIDRGLDKVKSTYEDSQAKGKISAAECAARIGLIQGNTNYALLSRADLVIEAVFEEMEVKHKVFRRLDEVCSDRAILATNTSTLDVNEIAEATKDPSRVLGLHFFSPANIMKLVEIVRSSTVSPSVLSSSLDMVKRIGKIGVT
ncbi:MAG: 3-hydroxyacyl-CoA dehydrogenase NAD-binding domain-containing protein, partial [Vicinamibacteria bacterium]